MAGMQRVRRARSEVQRWLRVREREGVSFAEIARRSGIPVGTLASWAHRLRQPAPEQAQGFVEVVTSGAPGGRPFHDADVITLRARSGARIELRGRFAEQVAARVLEQLGSWS